MSGPGQRLASLRITETSGVDFPANKSDGWLVIKATEPLLAERGIAALAVKLEARAAKLGIKLRDGAARMLAEGLSAASSTRDISFTEDEIDALLRAQAAPAEATPSLSPPTVEALAEKHLEDLQPGDPRNPMIARTVAVKAKALAQQQRLSPAEAVVKAATQMLRSGTPASRATAKVAGQLAGEGMDRDRAFMEAARATLALKSSQLREQAHVAKGVDPDVAAVAVLFREARLAKSLTQDQVATEVGISSRQVAKYEAGQALPEGINVFRVAGVLGLPIEAVREIGRLRGRAPE